MSGMEAPWWRRWVVFVAVTVAGLIADLWTKVWAFDLSGLTYDEYGVRERITVIEGWFDFTLALNKGAAFSMFSGQVNFFMIITVIAVLTLIYFVQVAPRAALMLPLTVGMILSGVLGNFWDRAVHGAVRDFISWHTPKGGVLFLPEYEYPTFNVADIWIFCGAIAMAWLFWKDDPKRKAAATAPPAEAPPAEAPPAEAPPPEALPATATASSVAPPPAAPPAQPSRKKKKNKKRR